ncbi:MAG: hypothetical protein VX902_06790, partial [Planctomycetota bacterium]|nr:hypothetical protein [Planctomycetota bacterium]
MHVLFLSANIGYRIPNRLETETCREQRINIDTQHMLPSHRIFLNPKACINLVVGGPRSGKWTWVTQWLEAKRASIDRLVIVSRDATNVRARTPALAPYVVSPEAMTVSTQGASWLAALHGVVHRKPRKEKWVVVLDHRHRAATTNRRHRFFRDTYGWGSEKNVTLFEVHRSMPALTAFERSNVDTLTVFPCSQSKEWNRSALSLSETPEVVLPAVCVGFPRFYPLLLDWTSGKEKRAVLEPASVKLLETPVWERTVSPVRMGTNDSSQDHD